MKTNKKGMLILCLLILSVILLIPASAYAADDIIRFGGQIRVGEDQTAHNVVAFGGPVRIEGTVNDVISFGGSVRSTGIIRGDTVVFGGGVLIEGPVGGDLVVFGGGINLGENAVINGDVITFGGGVSKHDDAIIRGKIVRDTSDVFVRGPEIFGDRGHEIFTGVSLWFRIVGGIFMVVFGWLIAVLMPRNTENILDTICNEGLKSFGIGLLIKLLAIPITIALLITLLGIPLIPIFWLTLWFAQLMGLAALGLLLGRKLFNKFGSDTGMGISVLVGLIVIALFRQIPFAGGIILFFVKSLVLGAVVISKFGTGGWGTKAI
ncbi:polymer-forming cytoskeletal protein [Desulfitibacter alkalitolerans]|uniref:polymer-forming cytoskeletal protein n=1 Tax=Desulfitibacter alkalitolerans TaxID=264641 RepID=UPI000488D7C5|nr:polymer-forming cytoskeletal protein [Desulfitibacter alkalitolerans]